MREEREGGGERRESLGSSLLACGIWVKLGGKPCEGAPTGTPAAAAATGAAWK